MSAPDPEASIAFLGLLRPGGPWVLTAITPDGPATTETFFKVEAASRWIERENASRNIYVMVAEATGVLRKKAAKDDVALTRNLWADVDGDPRGRLNERQNRGMAPTDRDLCRVTGPTVAMAAIFLRRIALPNLFRLGFETVPEEGASHARWLAGHILAHQVQDITAREIGRAYRPLRGRPGDIAWTMDILADAAWVVPADSP